MPMFAYHLGKWSTLSGLGLEVIMTMIMIILMIMIIIQKRYAVEL